jgi:hypothetical protein
MPNPSPAIFISHRRSDRTGEVGRLRDRLADRWGAPAVFLDINNIEIGVPFLEYIRQALSTSSILVAIIGPDWHSIADSNGLPRLRAPDDWVREEIAYALRHRITVIPVLVSGAKIPGDHDLPAELAPLNKLQAMELSQSRFDTDIKILIEAVEKNIIARYDSSGIRLRILTLRTARKVIVALLSVIIGSIVTLIWIITRAAVRG